MKIYFPKSNCHKIGKHILLIFLISLYSCNSVQKSTEYKKLFDYFNNQTKGLVSHFPSNIDFDNAFFSGQIVNNGKNHFGTYFHLLQFKANKEIDLFYKSNSTVVQEINPQDSCNLIVPWFSPFNHSKKDFDNCSDSVKQNCKNVSLPIPNFADETDLMQLSGIRLPIDFKLYILEIGKNKPFDYSYEFEGHGLPNEWKNGYSKGIAISKKRGIIIYWFDAW